MIVSYRTVSSTQSCCWWYADMYAAILARFWMFSSVTSQSCRHSDRCSAASQKRDLGVVLTPESPSSHRLSRGRSPSKAFGSVGSAPAQEQAELWIVSNLRKEAVLGRILHITHICLTTRHNSALRRSSTFSSCILPTLGTCFQHHCYHLQWVPVVILKGAPQQRLAVCPP